METIKITPDASKAPQGPISKAIKLEVATFTHPSMPTSATAPAVKENRR